MRWGGTTLTRNAYGNVLTQADHAGNTWTTSYTGRSDGLPTSISSPDPDGAGGLSAYTMGFAYDAYGQLTTTTYPDSSTQVLAYNTAGMVTSVTDELSHVTAFGYDALKRLTSVTGADPDGVGGLSSPVTSFTYDAASNMLTTVDALGNTTTNAYDVRNRLVSKTLPDPDGAGPLTTTTSNFNYDLVGNLASLTGSIYGDNIYFTHDVYGRLTQKSQSLSGKHDDYTFDVLGRLLTHSNSLQSGTFDQTHRYQYDTRGRVTKHTLPDPDGTGPGTASYELFAYNNAGQPSSHTDFLGNVTSYNYTAAGWLNSVTLPDADGSGPMFSPVYTLGYDALGNQTSVSDPNGHTSSKTWNNRGRLASVTGADPDGAGGLSAPTTSYGYDAHGNLTSITNPLSQVTYVGYDNLNRKTSLTLPDPDGVGALSAPVYAYGYNAMGSLTTQTDPLGNMTTTAYDNWQRRTSVTEADPDGLGALTAPVWAWTYGTNGMVSRVTDPMSHNTDYGYDMYLRRTTETNHDGHVTTTAYNLLDQVTSVTTADPDGGGALTASVTAYAYDYLQRLSSITDPLSGVTGFTYDVNSNLINLRDPLNNDTSWAYDNLGQVTMETNELGNTRSYWHDAVGNLTRTRDRNERVVQYTFDDLDRMTAEKWLASGDPVPAIAISTTTQGGATNEVQRVGFAAMFISSGTFTLSFGGQTTGGIAYNATAATVQAALEGLSTVGSGNVAVTKSQDTSTAQEWTLTFHGTLAGANQSQTTINSSGVSAMGKSDIQATDTPGGVGSNDEVQVVTLSNATDGTFRLAFGGQTTAPLAYNASAATVDSALEALTTVDTVTVSGSNGGPWTVTFTGSHANTNVAALQADAANAQSGSVSRTISYTYDVASQLTFASDPDGDLTFVYDAMGRVTSETQDINGLTPEIVLASAYDAASNRTELAATIGNNADFKNSYLYDNINRMTRVTQQSNSGHTLATKRVDFAYNALGQFLTIARYQNTGGTNVVATTSFTYDTMNRLSTLEHDQGATTLNHYSYGYDPLDRLTSITSTAEGSQTFAYDKTSQLVSADHYSQTDEAYSFDANGNQTGGSYTVTTNNLTTSDGTYNYTYDDEGNRSRKTTIATGDYEEYAWDHRNRLASVTFKTSGGTVTKTVEHQYDILNRWIRRHTDPDGPGGTAARDNFFAYDGIEAILQFDGTSDTDLIDRYLWGPAQDQILADEQVTSLSSVGNTIWPLTDHLGTARDLADQNESTHATTVTNHRTYNGFGRLVAETNSGVDSDPSYTGKITDSDTDLQNSWFRWYDAVLAQWASEDPIGFAGGDGNLRAYVANAPTLFDDPDGLQHRSKHIRAIDMGGYGGFAPAGAGFPGGGMPSRGGIGGGGSRGSSPPPSVPGMSGPGIGGRPIHGPAMPPTPRPPVGNTPPQTSPPRTTSPPSGTAPQPTVPPAASAPRPTLPPNATPPKGPPKPPATFVPPTNAPQLPVIPVGYIAQPLPGGGIIFRPPGTTGPANTIRVMPPSTIYPNGYWVPTNAGGQPINISTGKPAMAPPGQKLTTPISNSQTHVPLPPLPPLPSLPRQP